MNIVGQGLIFRATSRAQVRSFFYLLFFFSFIFSCSGIFIVRVLYFIGPASRQWATTLYAHARNTAVQTNTCALLYHVLGSPVRFPSPPTTAWISCTYTHPRLLTIMYMCCPWLAEKCLSKSSLVFDVRDLHA